MLLLGTAPARPACSDRDAQASAEHAAAAPSASAGARAYAARDSGVTVNEWTVPWADSRPRDPYVDGQGRVWFVGQTGNYVARLDPASGRFTRFAIAPGTHPHNLVVDARGAVWFTGNTNGRLVKLDPASGKLTDYLIPDAVRDPHTMTFDARGNAWFTAQEAGAVGRLDVASGRIRLWRTGEGSRPYGIATDAKGHVWFDLFGTNAIGMIDASTGAQRKFALPNSRTRPRRIAVTSDGTVWYGDYPRGFLGRLDPATGAVEEFALPSGEAALPYAMAVDDRDRVWVAETGPRPNRLVAFDPKTRSFTQVVQVEGQDAPNTIRHMVFHGPTRSVWYGTDRNTVGRARLQ